MAKDGRNCLSEDLPDLSYGGWVEGLPLAGRYKIVVNGIVIHLSEEQSTLIDKAMSEAKGE